MLSIYIEKLEQVESGVCITATVSQPYFDTEPITMRSIESHSEAEAEHDKLMAEFRNLHLGSAHLEQTAGG